MRLVEVREQPTTAEELLQANEAFLASTTREVQSVAAIEDRDLPEPGERTREAAAALRSHIEASL
jgi:branched-chain amino acid aminotransferase